MRAHVDRRPRSVGGVDIHDARHLLDEGSEPRVGFVAVFLGDRAVCDVEHEAVVRDHVAALVEDGGRVVVEPDDVTVLGHAAVFRSRSLAAVRFRNPVEDALAVVRVHDAAGEELGRAQPLVLAVAEDRLDLRADVDCRARIVGRVEIDDAGEILDERAVALLRFAALGFEVLALGDVPDVAPYRDDVSLGVELRDRFGTDPDDPPVSRDAAVLGHGRGALGRLDGCGRDELAIVRMDDRPDPQFGIRDDLARRVPDHLLDMRADVHRDGCCGDRVDVDDAGHLLDKRPVSLLGFEALGIEELAVGDVHEKAANLGDDTIRPADGNRVVVDPDDPAIGGDTAVLDLDPLTRAAAREACDHGCSVVRVDHLIEVVRGLREDRGYLVPEPLLEPWAEIDGRGGVVWVVDVHDCGDCFD